MGPVAEYVSVAWHSIITQNQVGAAAYQLGNTSSRTITEVKQR